MTQQSRIQLPLDGTWRFALDPTNEGVNFCGGWFDMELPDEVSLPGTTAKNRKGIRTQVIHKDRFSKMWQYTGTAWYQRSLEIPPEFADKRIALFLENPCSTMVWLDSELIGEQNLIDLPQLYEIGNQAFPGKHRLTIRCNNAPSRPMVYYHPRRANGITGRIELQITDKVWIKDVKVIPNLKLKLVELAITLGNVTGRSVNGILDLKTESKCGKHKLQDKQVRFVINHEQTEKVLRFEMKMGDELLLWDEFEPNLYNMEVSLQADDGVETLQDNTETCFGMREFLAKGTQFSVNNKTVFLRGTLYGSEIYAAETGRKQEDTEFWREIFSIYKEYGLNHVRFHTYCPPEAAFIVADELGLYLQPEMTLRETVRPPEDQRFEPMLEPTFKRHGEKMLRLYGNHPSFVMFSLGNEIDGDRDCMTRIVEHIRKIDPTRLYSEGSSNYIGHPSLNERDDYWVTMKVKPGHYPVRGSFSNFDWPLGPIQDEEQPGTERDFSESLEGIRIPIVAHEIGQYETSPNFDELELFKNVLIPGNLILLRDIMKDKGLLPFEKDFYKASGQLALNCYRQEIEMMLRTKGFGGFQMLGLQDILSQGSSLVGILNIFMKSKGMLTPEQWREFCSDRVLLWKAHKFVWETNESLYGKVEMANFGNGEISRARIKWAIRLADQVVDEGTFPGMDIPQGRLFDLGELNIPLKNFSAPGKYELSLALEGTSVQNHYPLWVFPAQNNKLPENDLTISETLDQTVRDALSRGGKVLLFPDGIACGKALEGSFASNFWSYDMFSKMSLESGTTDPAGTLGILCPVEHPIFRHFPTDTGSNFQWWGILMHSTPLILDDRSPDVQPLVHVIDNPMRCHRLGLIIEGKVGNGTILICATNLLRQQDDPAARQLLFSIQDYMSSQEFKPRTELDMEWLEGMFA